jgi:predicted anti-sigma-YlaC factor YlaD
MKCEEYEIMINSLVDGEPVTPRPAELFVHLADCRGCQNFLRYLLKLRNAEAELATDETLPSGAPALAQERQTGVREKHGPAAYGVLHRSIRVSVPSAAIAFVMLVLWTVALSLTIMRGDGSGERDEFQQTSLRSALTGPDQTSPDSH